MIKQKDDRVCRQNWGLKNIIGLGKKSPIRTVDQKSEGQGGVKDFMT